MDRQQRIQDLASQISALSVELNRLLITANPPQQQPPPAPARRSSERFPIGTRVRITNKYRGLQGQTGVVTRPTPVFIFFRLDSTGSITSRQRKNLRVISDPQ